LAILDFGFFWPFGLKAQSDEVQVSGPLLSSSLIGASRKHGDGLPAFILIGAPLCRDHSPVESGFQVNNGSVLIFVQTNRRNSRKNKIWMKTNFWIIEIKIDGPMANCFERP